MSKSEQIIISIEPALVDLYRMQAGKAGLSNSAYGRSLIIRELHKLGLLPHEFLVGVLLGQAQ